MRVFLALLCFSLLGGLASGMSPSRCDSIATDLENKDPTVFKAALQALLDQGCDNLLSRVAELFATGSCPARFRAADALALSGNKDYGPFLIKSYFEATAGIEKFDPGSLKDDVILACSNLPRGKKLAALSQYITTPPRLDMRCLKTYRELLGTSYHNNSSLAAGAVGLLMATATPEAMDIIEQCYSSPDRNIRSGAVLTLQHIPLDVSLPLFGRMIEDEYWGVRIQVVRLLSRIDDPRVESIFKKHQPQESKDHVLAIMNEYLRQAVGEP